MLGWSAAKSHRRDPCSLARQGRRAHFAVGGAGGQGSACDRVWPLCGQVGRIRTGHKVLVRYGASLP